VQHQKTLELERSRQKQRQGPTMEL
jgi:hypothetical protein